MKILLTTDGSVSSTTALRTASRLLRKGGREFEVICVAPKLNWPKTGGKPLKPKVARLHEQYQHQITLEAQKVLLHAQAQLAAEGITAKTLVESGSPARTISQRALTYDVVVVGAHDRAARGTRGLGAGLGHVASRVVAQAPNAVLVARELAAERSIRVLIGVDGSQAAEQALRSFATWFNAESAEIVLLQVIETPWLQLGLGRDWFGAPSQGDPATRYDRELRGEAEEVVETARQMLEELGLSAQTQLAEGDPALELLSEAESGAYDLLVLGSSGESDLKHSLLGSVSAKVAQDAPCSVFIVRLHA